MAEISAEGARGGARTWAMRGVRVIVTLLALAWVLNRIQPNALASALLRVPAWAVALAALLLFANVAILGTLRWRALLVAYGADSPPSLLTLARLNLVGAFYNTWLPGGVGGDVVRGVASRDAFRDSDATSRATGGVAVVFVERALGLVGLLVLSGAASLASARVGAAEPVPGLLAWSAIGITGGVVAISALSLGKRLGPRIPGAIGRVLGSVPVVVRPAPFVLACALSIAIHGVVAAIGHLAIGSLAPSVTLVQSMALVPVAMATQFLPITVGGAGAREMAFVVLYGSLGVAESSALAASLVVLLVNLGVSAIGSVLSTRVTTPAQPA